MQYPITLSILFTQKHNKSALYHAHLRFHLLKHSWKKYERELSTSRFTHMWVATPETPDGCLSDTTQPQMTRAVPFDNNKTVENANSYKRSNVIKSVYLYFTIVDCHQPSVYLTFKKINIKLCVRAM